MIRTDIGKRRILRMRSSFFLLLLTLSLLSTSCYRERTPSRFQLKDSLVVADTLTKEQQDSILFANEHHYSENFNFVVRADSLFLMSQEPEEWISGMVTDSFAVKRGESMVVADIRILPDDPVDSVWVRLATESYEFGWIHEQHLLKQVDPDDPISQFISTFSDIHLLIFLMVFTLIVIAFLLRKQLRRNNKVVHINDIPSPYPMALAFNVSASATFYASIQMFAPDMWREFYFSPSLNPFSQPLLMGLFLGSVWLMLILAIASVDEALRHLHFEGAVAYLLNLGAVCALCYILFSISTLYYVGYPLLIVYLWWGIRRHISGENIDI